jgi:hypothetical protein
VYELPFGPGRRFFSGNPAIINKAIEGWQLQGITTWESGVPLTIVANRATVNQANANLNPVQLLPGVTPEQIRENTGVFRTPAGVFFINPALLNISLNAAGAVSQDTVKAGLLASPAPGQFGNFPRNFLSGPRFFQTDFSIIKKTKIKERLTAEFRAEMFNVFNNVNFASPGNITFDSTSFGQLTTLVGSPRIVQFGMRLTF